MTEQSEGMERRYEVSADGSVLIDPALPAYAEERTSLDEPKRVVTILSAEEARALLRALRREAGEPVGWISEDAIGQLARQGYTTIFEEPTPQSNNPRCVYFSPVQRDEGWRRTYGELLRKYASAVCDDDAHFIEKYRAALDAHVLGETKP
jgi:hypothetical protein